MQPYAFVVSSVVATVILLAFITGWQVVRFVYRTIPRGVAMATKLILDEAVSSHLDV